MVLCTAGHCYTAKYLKGTGPVGERQEPVTGGEIWQHSELDRELKPIIPLVQTTSESLSPVHLMAGSNPAVCVPIRGQKTRRADKSHPSRFLLIHLAQKTEIKIRAAALTADLWHCVSSMARTQTVGLAPIVVRTQ